MAHAANNETQALSRRRER